MKIRCKARRRDEYGIIFSESDAASKNGEKRGRTHLLLVLVILPLTLRHLLDGDYLSQTGASDNHSKVCESDK